MTKYKLAILTSHPIQYQAPLFQKLTKQPEIELIVYFRKKPIEYDKEFGQKFQWDIPLLEGYKYKFLDSGFSISKELKQRNFDAILIYGWNSWVNWLAVLTAKRLGIKILLIGENPLNQELLKPKWKIIIKKIILGWLFRRVSAFLYIGEENKKFYKFYGVPDEKLFFAPYAVDNERFIEARKSLSENRKSLREKLGIKENDVVILFVGKLIEKKRPMDLLKAYETIIRNIRMRPNITNNTNEKKIIEKELSYQLTGIFFEIHNELGRFAREKQYADLLEKKLKERNIKYKRELPLKTSNKTLNIFDFLIEDKILVEIKRKPVNTADDYRQIMRYLESTGLELGILVNFGLEYLKPKRILNYKLLNHSDSFVNSDKSGFHSDYGIHLVFVGDGILRNELEKYAKTVIQNINYNPKYPTVIPNINYNPKYPNEYEFTNNTNKENKHEYSDDSHIRTNSYNSDYGLNHSDSFVNSDKFVSHSDYGIHFVGFKNQTELPQYYAISDIFVLPSGLGETWGLVVNEAMCFSLPIIVSDIVGCGPDLVKHGENGYIFKTGNIEELAKYLQELINHNTKYPTVIRNINYNPKYPTIIRNIRMRPNITNNTNEKNQYEYSDLFVNSDKFVSHSDYGLKIRQQFGEKSFEIIQNYSYEKDIEGILKALANISVLR